MTVQDFAGYSDPIQAIVAFEAAQAQAQARKERSMRSLEAWRAEARLQVWNDLPEGTVSLVK